MPISKAYKLCPNGIYLHGRMHRYAELSDDIHDLFYKYSPIVQSISIDEAFIDVTHSQMLFGSGPEIGQNLKNEILDTTGLSCSVGVAPSKFLAKRASEEKKPNGFFVINENDIRSFLDPKNVRDLWGVGPKTVNGLLANGFTIIGSLYQAGEERLIELYGETWGNDLWWLVNGGLGSNVVPDEEAKSIGHETTFPVDVDDMEYVESRLLWCADRVGSRLRRHELKGKTIQIKIRFTGFDTYTRARTLDHCTASGEEIYAVGKELMNSAPRKERKIRLIGVSVRNFIDEEGKQLELFEDPRRSKWESADKAIDSIQERFGKFAIRRARLLDDPSWGEWNK